MSHSDAEPLVYGLHQLSTTLRNRISAELDPLDLSFAEYVCLQALSTTPHQTNADLARTVGVSPQAMNNVVRRLQHGGLIDRPVSIGARHRPATLTADGRRALELADAAVRSAEEQALSRLTDAQRSRLCEAVSYLTAQRRCAAARDGPQATVS